MIHFHVHTSYSLSDAYGDVAELSWYEKPFVVTEHDNLYSYIKLRRAGIDARAGVELSFTGGRDHITLVAKDEKGFAILNQLVEVPTQYRTLQTVFRDEYKEHLIYLSGDAHTYFATFNRLCLLRDYRKEGYDVVVEIPVVPHNDYLINLLLHFAKEHDLPFIFTNDVHYPAKEYWIYCDIVLCVNSKKRFTNPNRRRHDTSLYLMNADEFLEKCNTYGIDKADVYRSFETAERYIQQTYGGMPAIEMVDVEQYDGDFMQYVLENQYHPVPSQEALQHEVNIITRKGYDKVFVLTHKLVKMIREKGIVTGYGRGSSAASVTAYVLGITHVNPILYKLDFSRFINEYRNDLPDIDIDIPARRRLQVEEAVCSAYGDNVTKLDVLVRYTATTAKNDIASYADGLPISHEEAVEGLVGKPRHKSEHPAGLCFGKDIARTFSYIDVEDASFLNLVKVDILGLDTLDILQAYKDEDGRELLEEFSSDKLKTMSVDLAQVGTAGIFQLQGYECNKVTQYLNPRTIDDVINTVALSRAPALAQKAHVRYATYSAPNIMKDLLPETRGVVLFQEQVTRILRDVGHFSMEECEQARRALSKLRENEFSEFIRLFRERAQFDYNESELNTIISSIKDSASYLFNKAHATAYTHLTYVLLYLKQENPALFTARYINAVNDDTAIAYLIADVRRKGVTVYLPKITRAYEYAFHEGKRAYATDGEVWLTAEVMSLKRATRVDDIIADYAHKLAHARKTFAFYPFHIHDEIRKYAERYVYAPLGTNGSTYVTLAYVVNYNPAGKCTVTDGDTVATLRVYEPNVMEVLRCADKTKATLVLKVSQDVITRAKTLYMEENYQ